MHNIRILNGLIKLAVALEIVGVAASRCLLAGLATYDHLRP